MYTHMYVHMLPLLYIDLELNTNVESIDVFQDLTEVKQYQITLQTFPVGLQ